MLRRSSKHFLTLLWTLSIFCCRSWASSSSSHRKDESSSSISFLSAILASASLFSSSLSFPSSSFFPSSLSIDFFFFVFVVSNPRDQPLRLRFFLRFKSATIPLFLIPSSRNTFSPFRCYSQNAFKTL